MFDPSSFTHVSLKSLALLVACMAFAACGGATGAGDDEGSGQANQVDARVVNGILAKYRGCDPSASGCKSNDRVKSLIGQATEANDQPLCTDDKKTNCRQTLLHEPNAKDIAVCAHGKDGTGRVFDIACLVATEGVVIGYLDPTDNDLNADVRAFELTNDFIGALQWMAVSATHVDPDLTESVATPNLANAFAIDLKVPNSGIEKKAGKNELNVVFRDWAQHCDSTLSQDLGTRKFNYSSYLCYNEALGQRLTTYVPAARSPLPTLVGDDITLTLPDVASLPKGRTLKLTSNQVRTVHLIAQRALPGLVAYYGYLKSGQALDEQGLDDALDAAAIGTWWSARESVLDLDNPVIYSNCNDRDDDPFSTKCTTPGTPWQVGVGAIQPHDENIDTLRDRARKYFAGMGKNGATLLSDATVDTQIITEIADANAAISTPTQTEQTMLRSLANRAGDDAIKKSWLSRHMVLAFIAQKDRVTGQCFGSGTPQPWCYHSGSMFAPDRGTADSLVAQFRSIYKSLADSM